MNFDDGKHHLNSFFFLKTLLSRNENDLKLTAQTNKKSREKRYNVNHERRKHEINRNFIDWKLSSKSKNRE